MLFLSQHAHQYHIYISIYHIFYISIIIIQIGYIFFVLHTFNEDNFSGLCGNKSQETRKQW